MCNGPLAGWLAGWLLFSKPLCTFQVLAQPKAGVSGSFWPARHSGARAILLLLYREHLVSALLLPESGELRQSGTWLLEETDPGTAPTSVTFLPWLQNPGGHNFLTKEELLQRCAQKAPGVSPEVGKDGAAWLWV